MRDIAEMRSAHATVDLHFKREPGRASGDQGDCLAPNHGSWVKVLVQPKITPSITDAIAAASSPPPGSSRVSISVPSGPPPSS